ncbi:MAG TPA: amino acid ABC transporter permease, partial [Pseudomonas sp.]|nr:amino acid ABC transporter permease [Pseudomonas sp.]
MQTHTFKPDLPPPSTSVGTVAWFRSNLFSNGFNTLLTLLAAYLVWLIVPPVLNWALLDANWSGSTRADCSGEGACWVFVRERFGQFMYGFFPEGLRWRVNLT